MKKILLAVLLVFGFIGGTFADQNVRWSRYGGYQPNQNHNGGHHNNHQHSRSNDWVAPLILGAGAGYLLARPTHQQPITVDMSPPVWCEQVQQRVTDRQGRPLYDQYTGQPLTQWVQVCPSVVR